MKEQIDLLDKNIEKKVSDLTKLLEKNLSYWNTFKLSVVRGFGAALGATLIIAATLYIVDIMLRELDYMPFISPALEYIARWLEAASP